MIISTVWWYMSRSTGLVAAVLIVAAFIWGILLSTRLLKPVKKPAWVLDLHRWLATLALVFVGLHLFGLYADSYVDFSVASLFIPFVSDWKPLAVTWGIISLYLLIAIQLTSWQRIRSRMSRRTWHVIHLASFPLIWLMVVHSGAAGTDARNRLYTVSLLVLIAMSVFVVLYRVLAGTGRTPKPRQKSSTPANATKRTSSRT